MHVFNTDMSSIDVIHIDASHIDMIYIDMSHRDMPRIHPSHLAAHRMPGQVITCRHTVPRLTMKTAELR